MDNITSTQEQLLLLHNNNNSSSSNSNSSEIIALHAYPLDRPTKNIVCSLCRHLFSFLGEQTKCLFGCWGTWPMCHHRCFRFAHFTPTFVMFVIMTGAKCRYNKKSKHLAMSGKQNIALFIHSSFND